MTVRALTTWNGVKLMAEYIILKLEVHMQSVAIEADSLEEAIEEVEAGEGDYFDLDYIRDLPVENWHAYLPDGTYQGEL